MIKPSDKKTNLRDKAKRDVETFIKAGGEIEIIPSGKRTEASTMKFKYRKKRVKKET